MTPSDQQSKTVWNNGVVPVIVRRGGRQPIRLRLPYAENNRSWLKNGPRKREPLWEASKKYWELPSSRFNEITRLLLNRFGKLYIIQPYKEQEVCAPACMNATGFECECSCMGRNHGMGNHGDWLAVNETFAVRYGDTQLACRLLVVNKARQYIPSTGL